MAAIVDRGVLVVCDGASVAHACAMLHAPASPASASAKNAELPASCAT